MADDYPVRRGKATKRTLRKAPPKKKSLRKEITERLIDQSPGITGYTGVVMGVMQGPRKGREERRAKAKKDLARKRRVARRDARRKSSSGR